MNMSKKSANSNFHERLKAIRRWRGFSSGAKAALAFGWAPGSYTVKEAGVSPVSPKQGHLYAEAFGVSDRFLLTGHPVTESDRDVIAFMEGGRRAANGRTASEIACTAKILVAVRIGRGFESKMRAARFFGFTYSTYKNHEDGRSPIPRRTAELYAYAYNVPPDTFHATLGQDAPAPEILATGKARSAAEVTAYMKENGDIRTVRDASVDVRLFEDVGVLFDVLNGENQPGAEQRTISISARRMEVTGLSADDFFVFRPNSSKGAVEVIVCLRADRVDADVVLRLTENTFALGSGGAIPASPAVRKSGRKAKAFLLPVMSVSLSASAAARLPLAGLFDTR
jgi:hypothetical protein